MGINELLSPLNNEQREAVTHGEGPLLVIAGAGTGKTSVIIRRIAYLIASKAAKPGEILALTFTDKAAEEMEARVDQLVPYGYVDVSLSTFHAFGDRVLKEYALNIGYPNDYKVLSSAEQIVFLREHVFKLPLKHYLSLSDPTRYLPALLNIISRAQDEDIGPDEYLAWAKKKKKRTEEIEKQLEVAEVYVKYQELKKEKGLVDFADQAGLTLQLFRKYPSILKKFQKRYKYILVDEFQDTNYSQFELLRLLAGRKANLMAVGDDDQCLPPNSLIKTESGYKRIKSIKVGDKVLTAVGKGHLSFSKVTRTMKKKKKACLLTFVTKSGKKIAVTSNHKMFCYVPSRSFSKNVYYVYLMHRMNMGWRLGITNDLATRLRLERSADKIIGLKGFRTENEARFHETLWSLKYGIPTVCFKEREGVSIKGKWLQKLYKEIDAQGNAMQLASDLGIDLRAHHASLAAVKRGSQRRIKINLEMCYRKYRSKNRNGKILLNPLVSHLLYLETSDPEVISTIKQHNIPFTKAKKGIRIRIASQDITKLGKAAENLKMLTDGIFEVKFSLGTMNQQHKPALIMPASNVLLGHYLPVIEGNTVVYDPIIEIKKDFKKLCVYDLEVEKTHNFVADGIVVHNSIYKFRGAAISNILGFSKTYKKAKLVVLTQNYRSTQAILDTSRRLIKHNDPDRLEVREGIDKKLIAAALDSKKAVEHKHFDKLLTESDWLARTIFEKHSEGYKYSDFAILVRANAHAEAFVQSLNMLGIPYQFSGGGGLYAQRDVKFAISFLRAIGDISDSISLSQLAISIIYNLPAVDLQKMHAFAKRRNMTLYHVISHLEDGGELFKVLGDIPRGSRDAAQKMVDDIHYYLEYASQKSTGEVLYHFLKKSGYLNKLMGQVEENDGRIRALGQFFERIREFKEVADVDRVSEFIKHLNLLKDAGENPETVNVDPDMDAVSVLTVHKAKGLEFRVVFLVSLVVDRFPVRPRKDPIELPDALLDEDLPKEDFHIQEERRLFYVGMTRAKEELYLTSAADYGGQRQRKISRFVLEALDIPKADITYSKKTPSEQIELFAPLEITEPALNFKIADDQPLRLSYYPIEDYLSCPLKYKYAHVLRVPILPTHHIVYGKAMHDAVQICSQARLQGREFSEKNLLDVLDHAWSSEGFISREHEEQRLKNARLALSRWYKAEQGSDRTIKFVEEEFSIPKDNIILRGRWDRVDTAGKNVHIVDFKTSDVTKQEDADKKAKESLQLSIYALVWKERFGEIPHRVELNFLESGLVGSVSKDEKDVDKTMEKIRKAAHGIRSAEFPAKPNPFTCKWCAYSEMCPARG
ncbi:MAG: UvrD-helicase domain-containing protein [Candidatus Margulisiibacteriota bacterium]